MQNGPTTFDLQLNVCQAGLRAPRERELCSWSSPLAYNLFHPPLSLSSLLLPLDREGELYRERPRRVAWMGPRMSSRAYSFRPDTCLTTCNCMFFISFLQCSFCWSVNCDWLISVKCFMKFDFFFCIHFEPSFLPFSETSLPKLPIKGDMLNRWGTSVWKLFHIFSNTTSVSNCCDYRRTFSFCYILSLFLVHKGFLQADYTQTSKDIFKVICEEESKYEVGFVHFTITG